MVGEQRLLLEEQPRALVGMAGAPEPFQNFQPFSRCCSSQRF